MICTPSRYTLKCPTSAVQTFEQNQGIVLIYPMPRCLAEDCSTLLENSIEDAVGAEHA